MKRKRTDLKPNGKPDDVLVISIDDGYVEWSFDVKNLGKKSIQTIVERMAVSLKRGFGNPRIRTKHCHYL